MRTALYLVYPEGNYFSRGLPARAGALGSMWCGMAPVAAVSVIVAGGGAAVSLVNATNTVPAGVAHLVQRQALGRSVQAPRFAGELVALTQSGRCRRTQ